MDYRIIYGGNRHEFPHSLFFNGIALGRTETYDAGKQSYWTFCKDTDVRDGISLSLGNRRKDYLLTNFIEPRAEVEPTGFVR